MTIYYIKKMIFRPSSTYHALINLAAFSCIIFLCLPKNIINVITKAKTMLKRSLILKLSATHCQERPWPITHQMKSLKKN